MENPESTQRHSDEEVPTELHNLAEAINELPQTARDHIYAAFHQVIDATRILNLVQETLGQLRMDMKYMMFDLEATRRERDGYRRQLEEMERDKGEGWKGKQEKKGEDEEKDDDDHFFD